MEHELRATTDSWNIVGHINGTKCVACKKTANNAEVLRCCKCKLMFHVVNCSEVDKDVLPPPSSLKLYIKFANKEFPTGLFSWTCFRCKSLETITDERNLEERVSLLEGLLVTLAPQIRSIAQQNTMNTREHVSQLVSSIRENTSSTANESSPPMTSSSTSSKTPYADALTYTPDSTSSKITTSAKEIAAQEKQLLSRPSNHSQTPTSNKRDKTLLYKVHATP